MERGTVDHYGLLCQRINDGKTIRDAKVNARLEFLRQAEELEQEIRLDDIKLAAWSEIEEDFRRAAAALSGRGDYGQANPDVLPSVAPAYVVRTEPPDDDDGIKRRKRGTKAKVIAYYESLNGAAFSIADVVRAIHATDADIPKETIGSVLSTLKGANILENIGFGRYRQTGVRPPLPSDDSAPGFVIDPADDFMDDIFSRHDDGGGGGNPDE